MAPIKGKITNAVSNFGRDTLEVVKEEAEKLKEEAEKQLGAFPETNEKKQEKIEGESLTAEEKIRESDRRSIKRIEEELIIAREKINEERKKREIASNNQTPGNEFDRKPIIQGLPASNGTAEQLPGLEEVSLPTSRPRRGFFPGVEKFKKKE